MQTGRISPIHLCEEVRCKRSVFLLSAFPILTGRYREVQAICTRGSQPGHVSRKEHVPQADIRGRQAMALSKAAVVAIIAVRMCSTMASCMRSVGDAVPTRSKSLVDRQVRAACTTGSAVIKTVTKIDSSRFALAVSAETRPDPSARMSVQGEREVDCKFRHRLVCSQTSTETLRRMCCSRSKVYVYVYVYVSIT